MAKPPTEMTAIEITEPGGPEVLRPAHRPVPEPGLGEVLIEVTAAGVKPAGHDATPGPLSATARRLGHSGTRGLGPRGGKRPRRAPLRGWCCGLCADQRRRLCRLLRRAGDSDAPVPAALSIADAAGLPETCFTVWTNLFERARLRAGERLLVHGGSSGIGTTAIQIASALGVRVFATAGSPEKCAACERLGAERAIDYRSEDFVSVAKELTGGEGVDVVLDMVGGSYVQRNLATLRPEGRLAQIAFLEGSKCQIDLNSLMRKRLSIVGSTLRPQSVESKARIAASLEQNVWPLVESGLVRPVIDCRLPLEQAAAAHARMEDGQHIGKILLERNSR